MEKTNLLSLQWMGKACVHIISQYRKMWRYWKAKSKQVVYKETRVQTVAFSMAGMTALKILRESYFQLPIFFQLKVIHIESGRSTFYDKQVLKIYTYRHTPHIFFFLKNLTLFIYAFKLQTSFNRDSLFNHSFLQQILIKQPLYFRYCSR